MRSARVVVLLAVMLLGLSLVGGAAATSAPLEIDILEEYLATTDVVPFTPHCARHHGYAFVPEQGPMRLPAGATNLVMQEHVDFHYRMKDGPSHFHPSPEDEDQYGKIFLEWHEYYVGLYQRWRGASGHAPLLGWNPATPMPPELEYAHPGRGCMEGRNDDPGVPLPTWATLDGGEETDPMFGHARLCEFKDINQFGKSISLEWHRAFHAGVGGDMGALFGPRDPAFWAGHQFLIDLTDDWRRHCSGAAAAPVLAEAEGADAVERTVPAIQVPGFLAVVAVAAASMRGSGRRP